LIQLTPFDPRREILEGGAMQATQEQAMTGVNRVVSMMVDSVSNVIAQKT
jgi:hypothetical protein